MKTKEEILAGINQGFECSCGDWFSTHHTDEEIHQAMEEWGNELTREAHKHLIEVVECYFGADNEIGPEAFEAAARYLEKLGLITISEE